MLPGVMEAPSRVQVGVYSAPCSWMVPPGRTRMPKRKVLIPLTVWNRKVRRELRRQVALPPRRAPYTSMDPRFHTRVLSSRMSCEGSGTAWKLGPEDVHG